MDTRCIYMTKYITNFIIGFIFLAYSFGLGYYCYSWGKKSVKVVTTQPSVSHFSGVPDSTKETSDSAKLIVKLTEKLTSKPDSSKVSDEVVNQTTIPHYPVDNSKPWQKKYTSYKSFSDSLGSYDIEVTGNSPADNIALTVHHFAMKMVEECNKVEPFFIGVAVGAVAVIIVEAVIFFLVR